MRPGPSAASLALVLTLAAALPGRAAARPAFDPFAVPAHTDARDAGDPLDLRSASFGESATEMVLRLRTAGAWQSPALAPDSVCITLHAGRDSGRLCAGARAGRPALLYTRPGTTTPRFLDALITRPDSRSLTATFAPRALRLRGAIAWRAETHTPAELADSLPDRGSYVTTVGAFGTIRCFGAAAARALREPRTAPPGLPEPVASGVDARLGVHPDR